MLISAHESIACGRSEARVANVCLYMAYTAEDSVENTVLCRNKAQVYDISREVAYNKHRSTIFN